MQDLKLEKLNDNIKCNCIICSDDIECNETWNITSTTSRFKRRNV